MGRSIRPTESTTRKGRGRGMGSTESTRGSGIVASGRERAIVNSGIYFVTHDLGQVTRCLVLYYEFWLLIPVIKCKSTCGSWFFVIYFSNASLWMCCFMHICKLHKKVLLQHNKL